MLDEYDDVGVKNKILWWSNNFMNFEKAKEKKKIKRYNNTQTRGKMRI